MENVLVIESKVANSLHLGNPAPDTLRGLQGPPEKRTISSKPQEVWFCTKAGFPKLFRQLKKVSSRTTPVTQRCTRRLCGQCASSLISQTVSSRLDTETRLEDGSPAVANNSSSPAHLLQDLLARTSLLDGLERLLVSPVLHQPRHVVVRVPGLRLDNVLAKKKHTRSYVKSQKFTSAKLAVCHFATALVNAVRG